MEEGVIFYSYDDVHCSSSNLKGGVKQRQTQIPLKDISIDEGFLAPALMK
jgi:hypothetical protein